MQTEPWERRAARLRPRWRPMKRRNRRIRPPTLVPENLPARASRMPIPISRALISQTMAATAGIRSPVRARRATSMVHRRTLAQRGTNRLRQPRLLVPATTPQAVTPRAATLRAATLQAVIREAATVMAASIRLRRSLADNPTLGAARATRVAWGTRHQAGRHLTAGLRCRSTGPLSRRVLTATAAGGPRHLSMLTMAAVGEWDHLPTLTMAAVGEWAHLRFLILSHGRAVAVVEIVGAEAATEVVETVEAAVTAAVVEIVAAETMAAVVTPSQTTRTEGSSNRQPILLR